MSTPAKADQAKPADVAPAATVADASKTPAVQEPAVVSSMAPLVVKASTDMKSALGIKKDLANTMAAQQASLSLQLADDSKGQKASLANFLPTGQQALSMTLPTIGRPGAAGSDTKGAAVDAYHAK